MQGHDAREIHYCVSHDHFTTEFFLFIEYILGKAAVSDAANFRFFFFCCYIFSIFKIRGSFHTAFHITP